MTSDSAAAVSRELAGSGMSPDPAHSNYVLARMYHFGAIEYERLRKTIGCELERQARAAIRQLGFGRVMTEFAIAHLPIPGKPEAAVLSLGALANLIVSTYDGLLDSGRDPERILSRSRLTGAGNEPATDDPYIARLVEIYFTRVSSLTHPHAQCGRNLRSAILRMYDAERLTVGSPNCSHTIWRRKSALPFVIMGLPVWMTVPLWEGRACLAHSRWLYRLGQFFGWIDDAADLDADRSAGRPNYFSSALEPLTACRIARLGSRILEAWDVGAPAGRYGRTLRQTFLAVTWSWLGMHKTGAPG